jgi:hypothetical protein
MPAAWYCAMPGGRLGYTCGEKGAGLPPVIVGRTVKGSGGDLDVTGVATLRRKN